MTTKPDVSLPTAKDFMQKLALAEAEEASKQARKHAEAEAEKQALLDHFKKPSGVSDEEGIRRAIKIIERAVNNGLTGVQVCRFPNQLCTDRGPSNPYGPSCWDEVPGFNRCRKSATHAQCREVRRMRCIVSTLVTARGRAAPPALAAPLPTARRRRGCRRTAPIADWRTTVQIG